MKNLWKQSFFWIGIGCSATILYHFATKQTVMADELSEQSLSSLISQKLDNLLVPNSLIAQQKQNYCQLINLEYKELYSFETRNYNIGICHQNEQWFYYRGSKSNPNDILLLPAQAVFGGDVFQAVKGKVTYFVGTNSDGYYSSVMYGNNQMIFEPELSRNTANSKQESNSLSVEVMSSEIVNDLDLDLSANYWKVCTEDKDDVHPYLNGWQKFIGESPQTIDEYASMKGYKFQYQNNGVPIASVETTDGLMVTLDIGELTETVSSVCVRPITSF